MGNFTSGCKREGGREVTRGRGNQAEKRENTSDWPDTSSSAKEGQKMRDYCDKGW